MNYFGPVVSFFVMWALLWWVAKWKFPMPAKLIVKINSVQEEEKQFTVQAHVEEVIPNKPQNIFGNWARPYVMTRLPKAGQNHTFTVPKKKMRVPLREGEYWEVSGRILRLFTGEATELSIHEGKILGELPKK